MEQYVFDLGIETSKTMNAMFSLGEVYSNLRQFLRGDVFQPYSKLIYPTSQALPSGPSGVSGALFFQSSIYFSHYNGEYALATPTHNAPEISAINDSRYTKFTQSLSGSHLTLWAFASYEVVANMKESRFRPHFSFNTSSYYSGEDIIFTSVLLPDRTTKDNSLLGYSAGPYLANYGQTKFGVVIAQSANALIQQFSNLEADISEAFQDLVENCASFSGLSYTNQNCIDNFCDLNSTVKEAFSHFASIDLNV